MSPAEEVKSKDPHAQAPPASAPCGAWQEACEMKLGCEHSARDLPMIRALQWGSARTLTPPGRGPRFLDSTSLAS